MSKSTTVIDLAPGADLSDIHAPDDDDILGGFDDGPEPADDTPEEPLPPPPLTFEEKKRKAALIAKLLSYAHSSFKDALAAFDLTRPALDALTIERLAEMVSEVQETVSMRSNKAFLSTIFFSGIGVLEGLGTRAGLRISGLSHLLAQQAEVGLLVEEISLKYQDYIYVKPEIKLGLITFSAASQPHNSRTIDSKITSFLAEPAPKKLVDDFKDI